MKRRRDLPLIYACSGCSNVAQLANDVAVHLDHAGQAEMSCIAGVGGGVPALVRVARSGRPIIGIDGCQLHCVQHCLAQADVVPTHHVRLYEFGFKKRSGRKAEPGQFDEVVRAVESLLQKIQNGPSEPSPDAEDSVA